MGEKKLFNAAEHLKDYNPVSIKNEPFLRSILINTGYSNEEWQEYIHGQEEWKRTRSEKHFQMAKAYAITLEKLERE